MKTSECISRNHFSHPDLLHKFSNCTCLASETTATHFSFSSPLDCLHSMISIIFMFMLESENSQLLYGFLCETNSKIVFTRHE